jgi:hypothetical protein
VWKNTCSYVVFAEIVYYAGVFFRVEPIKRLNRAHGMEDTVIRAVSGRFEITGNQLSICGLQTLISLMETKFG